MSMPYAIMTNLPRQENFWKPKISSDKPKNNEGSAVAKNGEPSYDFKTKEGIRAFIAPYLPKQGVFDSGKREEVFSELSDVVEKAKPQNKEEAKAALRIYLRIKDIEIKSKGRISVSDVQIKFTKDDPLCNRVHVKVEGKVIGSDNKGVNFSFEKTPSASKDGVNSFVKDFEKYLEEREIQADNKPISSAEYSVDAKPYGDISKIYELIIMKLEESSKQILDAVTKPKDPVVKKKEEQRIAEENANKKKKTDETANKLAQKSAVKNEIDKHHIPGLRVPKTLIAKLKQIESKKVNVA